VRAGKRWSDLVLALGEGCEFAQKREQKNKKEDPGESLEPTQNGHRLKTS
jgi:hypothetical protein